MWYELHQAKIVYIQQYRLGKKRLGAYLCKYFAKDMRGERVKGERFWSSWNWVFRGYVGVWALVVKRYKKYAVRKWHAFLRGDSIVITRGYYVIDPPWVRQLKIETFGG